MWFLGKCCITIPVNTLCYFFFFFFAISWAAPAAYGGSQDKGRIGATAAGLHHSRSNVGSELRL